MKKQAFSKYYIFTCLSILSVYILPYLYFWTNSSILIHDNLDFFIPQYKLLLESGELFSPNWKPIPQLLNGIPRSCLPSELDFFIILFYLFDSFGAYVANVAIVKIVALLGMFLLLRQHIIPGDTNTCVHFGIAVCFSLLPFWPMGGISVSGVPLVIFAYFNLREGQNKRWFNWLILLLYPFYSSLVLCGFFLIIILGITWLYDVLSKKHNTSITFIGLTVLSITYLLVNYRLFVSFFFIESFVSHRTEFNFTGVSFTSALQKGFSMFKEGQYHAHSLHGKIILPLVLITGTFLRKKFSKENIIIFYSLLFFLLITSLWYGLLKMGIQENGQSINSWLLKILPIKLERFHFLHPVAWMVLLAIALSTILKISQKMLYLVYIILLLQVIHEFQYHELYINRSQPSFKQFFAEKQFNSIATFLKDNNTNYRVVSLGIHPSIAQYNGFYTLDGYFANYPLNYKKKYREIIASELNKNTALKHYYDNWGSRIYLFSNELKKNKSMYLNRSGNNFEIDFLDINVKAFRNMGGRYILSAVQINENNNPEITLLKKFFVPESAWDIYLYRVGSPI